MSICLLRPFKIHTITCAAVGLSLESRRGVVRSNGRQFIVPGPDEGRVQWAAAG